MTRPVEGVRASGLPMPWGARIALAIALFAFAYADGRMSGLSGEGAWWVEKIFFVASLATLALLVLDARASRNGLTTTAMPHAEGPTDRDSIVPR